MSNALVAIKLTFDITKKNMYINAIRFIQLQAKNNSYFILFFLIGLFLNFNFSYIDVCEPVVNHTVVSPQIKVGPAMGPQQNAGSAKKLIRPRYYSTELGIREKLFVGVLTSMEQLELRAVAVNRTVAHLSDKVKFFMSASHKYRGGNGLGNIVGFTDARESLRPFHIIKYISDGFGQNYDYFFLMKDSSYLDARMLKYIANKVSVSQDVYLGSRVPEGSYCSLDAGILLSNSVLMAMRHNLEWCVRNAFSDNHSDNLGRCIAHSIGLECQEQIQGQSLSSYRLKHYNLQKSLSDLSHQSAFLGASVLYPVSSSEDMYTLHALRCRDAASLTRQQTDNLQTAIQELRSSLPHEHMQLPWPLGHRPGNKPFIRFDVARRTYFNLTHKYFGSDFCNVSPLMGAEREDVERVLRVVVAQVHHDSSHTLKYRRLVNGYSVFDLSRGLDYILDLGFRDQNSGKEVIKRYHICKPLGKVEMLPMPYVTENKRITVLIPIWEQDIPLVSQFAQMYSRNVMSRNQKTIIMFALLYGANSPSKGANDSFLVVKNLAVELSNKHQQQDNNKVAWVSIRLPQGVTTYSGALHFAVVDLALKKIGPDSLVLLLDLHVDVTVEFLNRVRMNTIMGTQVFSIIPFRQYHPRLSATDKLQVHKTTGQFDSKFYGYISFYGRDYINVRLSAEQSIPIVRTDKDISELFEKEIIEDNDIFKLFVSWSEELHCMRATDPGLKLKHHAGQRMVPIGSKAQLAKLILTYDSTLA